MKQNKYVLTQEGIDKAKTLKVSKIHLKSGLSNTIIYRAIQTGQCSAKTLQCFLDNLKDFKENIHYIKL